MIKPYSWNKEPESFQEFKKMFESAFIDIPEKDRDKVMKEKYKEHGFKNTEKHSRKDRKSRSSTDSSSGDEGEFGDSGGSDNE